MPNNTFNLNNSNLKEFKLNPEILSEMSNLNKKLKMNPNFFESSNFFNPQDNFFSSIEHQNDNINNKINFNNINLNNNYNINYNINFINNDMSFNKFSENNINNINLLPLNKSFYDYTEDELLQYAIPLIKDQSGCRFLQERIKTNQYFANELLFPHIKNDLKELGCDAFGNYFLQVLIDVLSHDKVNQMLDLMKNYFTSLCICPHGTRVVQKLIEKINDNPDLMKKFINNLNSNDLGIIFKSPYGNHIMQKFLTTIHLSEFTKFIYDYTFDHFMEIAGTKHGVCVIQKCVSEGDEKQRVKIYEIIIKNLDSLIKDQFGNYLIQYILINTKTKEKFMEIMPIIKKIEENLIYYCKCKFSANVIEKCFENKENYIREHFLEYLLNHYKDNIMEILLDQYGIYIILKALKLNSIYKTKLYQIISQKENEIKNINLNDFKYKGILKIINSNKELSMIFFKAKESNDNNVANNTNGYNNNFNINTFNNNNFQYNNHITNNNYFGNRNNLNNNRGKNKRGKKNFRGNNKH